MTNCNPEYPSAQSRFLYGFLPSVWRNLRQAEYCPLIKKNGGKGFEEGFAVCLLCRVLEDGSLLDPLPYPILFALVFPKAFPSKIWVISSLFSFTPISNNSNYYQKTYLHNHRCKSSINFISSFIAIGYFSVVSHWSTVNWFALYLFHLFLCCLIGPLTAGNIRFGCSSSLCSFKGRLLCCSWYALASSFNVLICLFPIVARYAYSRYIKHKLLHAHKKRYL